MSQFKKGSPKEAAVSHLTSVRKGRGISLEEVADSTKISIRCLKAIEAGEFEKLPGGIYTINYVKQYAKCVGLDEQELLEDCNLAELNKPEPLPAQKPRGPIMRLLDYSWALLNF